jgi:hypothetical protein
MLRQHKELSWYPVVLATIGFWLILLLMTPNVARATPLGDLAASMQPGTWAELVTSNIGVLNQNGTDGNILPYAADAGWDPNSRKLIYVGNDHIDSITSQADHFVIYNADTNSWQNMSPPPWSTPGVTDHGYYEHGVNPANGNVYRRGGKNSPIFYKYNITTNSWTALPANNFLSQSSCCSAVDYFPELGGLINTQGGEWGGGVVDLFNESTQQWSRLAQNLSPMTGPTFTLGVYNPIYKVMVFGQSGAFYKLDSAGTVTRLSNPPVTFYDGTGYLGILTVDPVGGKYLFLTPTNRQLYAYDLATDTWQTQSSSNKPNLINYSVIAAPISNYGIIMFVACQGVSCHVYLYKHSDSNSPPPSPTPTVTLSANPTSITSGSSSVLAWNSTNATTCTASGGWSGTKAVSGSQSTGNLTANTTFSLTCTGSGSSTSQSATVVVTSSTPPTTPPPSTPSGTVGGYPMPTLQSEKDTYTSWGWTWTANKEPGAVTEPIGSYTVSNPDIHGDTEGDDLWTYLMMYRRTGNTVYLNRANAWARYFKNDYRNCVGSPSESFCFDRDSFGLDHFYGWGLIALYEHNGDTASLTEAENLAAVLETMYGPNTTYGCLPAGACIFWGPRAGARHLLFMTRLAQVTGNSRWITLRDKIINLWLTSAQWNPTYGTYFVGDSLTDEVVGAGAYATGARIQSAFQLALVSEAFDFAYRATGNQELKNRMIAMARFVDRYGLDSTYQYTASWFGIVNGNIWHIYSAKQPVTFWDPVYTTSLVNVLVRGYKYSGDINLYNRAKQFFNRGTKGIYGSITQRQAADNVVGHFVDTIFASSAGNFYLEYNKGELQYTYLIFENGGFPTVETGASPPPVVSSPIAPSNLVIK